LLLNATEIPDGKSLRSSVCVVGAGPAGIAIALQLAKARHDVVLVEAGGIRPESDTESLSGGEVATGSLHVPLEMYRRRVIGGSTYVWGGRCTPFDPIDFERRPWIPDSGWPITYTDLLPWYQHANTFLDAGRFDYLVAESLRNKGPFIEGFSHPWLHTDRIERFSRPSNVWHHYRNELKSLRELRLLHHAVCTHIGLHRSACTANAVTLRTLGGTKLSVVADCFVLALGTIETVRLLLASSETAGKGIGNHSDWLGRCYLSHLEGSIGELKFSPSNRKVIWGYEKSDDGIYVRRRFAVSASAQELHGTGNAIARLNHSPVSDPTHGDGILSAAFLAKNFLVPEYNRRISWTDRRTADRLAALGRWRLLSDHIFNVVKDLPRLVAFAPWWFWVRNLRRRKMPSLALHSNAGTYLLDFNIEQSPNRESRILLADSCDRFGVPHVKVAWRTNDVDRRTIMGTLQLFREAFKSSGCGEFAYDQDEAIEKFMQVGGHQMGGTRMARHADEGVVDSNCAVHGIENLFLAGNQVFPTVSYANPTLTNVALAIRLASHLHRRLKGLP
jgi:choline dehydrogenase-like flavoprotein